MTPASPPPSPRWPGTSATSGGPWPARPMSRGMMTAVPAGGGASAGGSVARRSHRGGGSRLARRNRPAGGGSFARGTSLAGGGGLAERRGWPRRPGGRCRAVLPRELSILPQAEDAFRVSGVRNRALMFRESRPGGAARPARPGRPPAGAETGRAGNTASKQASGAAPASTYRPDRVLSGGTRPVTTRSRAVTASHLRARSGAGGPRGPLRWRRRPGRQHRRHLRAPAPAR